MFFSRFWKYSQQGLLHVLDVHEDNGIPLDGSLAPPGLTLYLSIGINLDTEWHRNLNYLETGGGGGWYSGAFDWDRTLYDDPERMISFFKVWQNQLNGTDSALNRNVVLPLGGWTFIR